MTVNVTECMQYTERGFAVLSGRRKCKHLDKGVFGGYVCKLGHRIDFTPRISKDNPICKDKEIAKSA